MKAITLRNIPPEIQRVIQKVAREKGSLNQAVISLLYEGVGLSQKPKKPRKYRDLDKFFGTWTKEEADEFDKCLAEQRKIDPELWK